MGFDDGKVRISWGTNDGIVQGILLNVLKETAIYHPVTREQFGTSESIIGSIEVTECYADYSFGRVIESSEQINIGHIIRISFDESSTGLEAYEEDKGTIIEINNKLIKFNMGNWDGVEDNLIFDVFRAIGTSRHPVTGENVEPRNLYIGRIMVMNVNETESLAQVISQEREIQIGDRVILSLQQAGDLEISTGREEPLTVEQYGLSEAETGVMPEQLSEIDNIVGTVTRISDRDIFFLWRGDYDFPSGRVFGIYRREELRHPESKTIIGNPLVLLGRVSLIESIGEIGRGNVLSTDADILPQDLIGLTEGETVQSGQVITPGNAEQVFRTQKSDLLEHAQELTDQVQHIQGEMVILRTALDRLDRIDRELSAQKAVTQSMNSTLEEIKMLLRGEGFPVESSNLVPSRASIDRIEMPGSETNVLRLKYTDDIAVKLELMDKTLLVSLDIDSVGKYQMTSRAQERPVAAQVARDTLQAAQDSLSGTGLVETVTDDEGSFFTNWLFLIIVIVALLGVAGALYFLLVLKKKKSGDGDEKEDDEESGEIEDMEEGEFGEETAAEDEEEEVPSFEDDEEF